jgi:hypothetical protein
MFVLFFGQIHADKSRMGIVGHNLSRPSAGPGRVSVIKWLGPLVNWVVLERP